jgi:hypothetical protein
MANRGKSDDMQNLNDVVLAFTAWQSPWQFHDHVATNLDLSDTDRTLFEQIWQEALNGHHWQLPDLAQCTRLADEAIRTKFPSITADAASAIADAAAYQWR